MPGSRQKKSATYFRTVVHADVPQGRNETAQEIVTIILKDLDRLGASSALKVSLTELTASKEKVRSALNRATRQAGRKVLTAGDDDYLYVWNGEN